MESEDPEVAVNGAAAVPSGSVGVKILSIVVEEWEPPRGDRGGGGESPR